MVVFRLHNVIIACHHSTSSHQGYNSFFTNITQLYFLALVQTVCHSTNILGSNLELEANHAEWGFLWFYCLSRRILESKTLKQDTTASLHVSPINDANYFCYLLSVMNHEKAVLKKPANNNKTFSHNT